MLKTGFDMMRGKSPEVFLDKLGERLAYERNGVRLYEAMIAKVKALDTPDTATVDTLMHIRNEEHEHMMLVHGRSKPSAPTRPRRPLAPMSSGPCPGIVNVLTDPRTNVDQYLNALLTVELADNAAWELLIELAQAAGHPNIADSFTKAKTRKTTIW